MVQHAFGENRSQKMSTQTSCTSTESYKKNLHRIIRFISSMKNKLNKTVREFEKQRKSNGSSAIVLQLDSDDP